MKPIISRLSHHSILFFFPLLLILRWKPKFRVLFLFLSMIILAGCFEKYYTEGTTDKIDTATIEKLKTSNKYFIIHFQDTAFHLSDITIDSNNMLLGKMGKLPIAHSTQLNPKEGQSNVVKKKYLEVVLTEVHIYSNYAAGLTEYPTAKIPLSSVYKLNIYQFDKKSTNASTLLSVVGIVAAGGIIILVVALASANSSPSTTTTSSSSGGGCKCPQVYVEQKGNFNYQNGIFTGAASANLERIDYLPLNNVQPENSIVHLRLTSHDNEVQFINSARLIGVYHKEGSLILADRFGKLFSVTNPQLPVSASGSGNKDLKERLSKADGDSYRFNTYDSQEDFSKTYLTFKRPPDTKKARLLIRAKNSAWAAVLNQEFTLLFGDYYTSYRAKMEHTSSTKIDAFMLNQALPIKVYVEDGGKWEYAGYFPLSGSDTYRDMIMEINLPENRDNNIRIRLETVYRLWDLDYTAIDYSDAVDLQKFSIDPITAVNNLNGDQISQLAKKDKIYTQLNNDDFVDLQFKIPEKANSSQVAYFLASSGYYHIQNTYPVKPNFSMLRKFESTPAEFDRFSRLKYRELEQMQALARQSNQVQNKNE